MQGRRLGGGSLRAEAAAWPAPEADPVSGILVEPAELEISVEPTPGGPAVEGRSPWRLAWARLRTDRVAIGCATIILLITLFAILAPLVAHITGHGPNDQDLTSGLTPAGLPRGPSTGSGSEPTTSAATSSSASPTARGSR